MKTMKFSEAVAGSGPTRRPRSGGRKKSTLKSRIDGMNASPPKGPIDGGGHNRPRTRQGKRMIGAWFDPPVHNSVALASKALSINLQTFLMQAIEEKLAAPDTQRAIKRHVKSLVE